MQTDLYHERVRGKINGHLRGTRGLARTSGILMIYLVAFIVVLFNWIGTGSDFSLLGQRLVLDPRPVMVPLRWLGMGMVLALAISGYPAESNDWIGWTSVLILAIGSTRRRVDPVPRRLPPLDGPASTTA